VNASISAPIVSINAAPGWPGFHRPTPEEIAAGWEPLDQEKLDASIRSRHYLLPSYTANAVEIVGAHEDGWMVGEHGAILRLSTSALDAAQGSTEPKPPIAAPTRTPGPPCRRAPASSPPSAPRPRASTSHEWSRWATSAPWTRS
jgi:hypothetical protein